jgi:hypothetical protein
MNRNYQHTDIYGRKAMRKKVKSNVPVPMSVLIEGRGDRLRIECSDDPALLADFALAWRKRPKKIVTAFKRFVLTHARGAIPVVRPRTGTLNPRIPSPIHARFLNACENAKPAISQAEAIKRVLSRYIDIGRTVRRTVYDSDGAPVRDHYGQRRKRAPLREELDNPTFDAEPKEKLQFDPGPKLKAVIEDLIADLGVGKSRFFAFVVSEATAELERHQQPKQTTALPTRFN